MIVRRVIELRGRDIDSNKRDIDLVRDGGSR